LKQVQSRSIKTLKDILEEHKNPNIVIGTHGTLLGVTLNYFNQKYDYQFWKTIEMPDIFLLIFNNKELEFIKIIELD
jgi:2,3-bisphosphoglycerate-dependent phosphoglycerate mutase